MTGYIARIFCGIAVTLMLSACDHSRPEPISTGDRYLASATVDESYVLGAGDKVHIAVFAEQQLSGDFSVSGDGLLSLPLIGDVSVAGQTTAAASRAIEALLGNGYLRNPRVTMEVSAYRPYFILGEVRTPGQYPYMNGLTVTNAIAAAQGFTPRARRKVVLIRRFGEQVEQEYVLTPDLRVRPGDTIRLDERYF